MGTIQAWISFHIAVIVIFFLPQPSTRTIIKAFHVYTSYLYMHWLLLKDSSLIATSAMKYLIVCFSQIQTFNECTDFGTLCPKGGDCKIVMETCHQR